MDDRAHRMYLIDCAVIWISLVVMWGVLGFTLTHILALAAAVLTRLVIVAAAALAGVFATSALIALQLHLHRQRTSLYPATAGPATPR